MRECLSRCNWALCNVGHPVEIRCGFLVETVEMDGGGVTQHHVRDMDCHHLTFVYYQGWARHRPVDNFDHSVNTIDCNDLFGWHLMENNLVKGNLEAENIQ